MAFGLFNIDTKRTRLCNLWSCGYGPTQSSVWRIDQCSGVRTQQSEQNRFRQAYFGHFIELKNNTDDGFTLIVMIVIVIAYVKFWGQVNVIVSCAKNLYVDITTKVVVVGSFILDLILMWMPSWSDPLVISVLEVEGICWLKRILNRSKPLFSRTSP